MKRIILLGFNWIFRAWATNGDIETIRLVTRERLRIDELDVETVRLVNSEKLYIQKEYVGVIQRLQKELSQESVNYFYAQCPEGGALRPKIDVELLNALERVALLNRLGDIFDISNGTQLNYAQEGEALILERFFNFKENGFFVDVGAHHPKRLSNTYSLYKHGWRGINIDPTPGVKELFDSARPEDISLSVAVSDVDGWLDFYMFAEPALNTFSKSLANEYLQADCELLKVQQVETKRLSRILEESQVDRPIDFMSIDVEDHELPVLQSNDWDKFRPRVLLVEILNFDINATEAYPVHNFILDKGYVLFAKTFNTVFYKSIQ